MAEEPDRLRRNIEQTRASLTRDVDLLAEKTSPSKVATIQNSANDTAARMISRRPLITAST